MENATKALLISGAVLVSLVLIGIGINLVSTGKKHAGMATGAGNEMSDTLSQATSEFNHRFSNRVELVEMETEVPSIHSEDDGHVTKPGNTIELPHDPIIDGSSMD